VDLRTRARRRAEVRARKVPIRMLFPLVTCILPAFILLSVVPMVGGALRELGPGI
jgi:pilus assembly protein TadC